jgi:hypothetical protein
VRRLYELTVNRPPSSKELEATERFLREQTALIRERLGRGEPVARLEGVAGVDPAEGAAWADLCLAALNMNEFIYVR